MKVSVVMITYGHENFIAEAVNSVLEQNLSDDFELIISNDCSPDNTDNIIYDLMKNHPKGHLIKYFSHKKNLGVLPNFVYALKQATGEYIALCEGDDFCTDKHKLSVQTAFLDNNPNYVGCFHNTEERYEDSSDLASFLMNNFSHARSISFKDLTDGNIMATCSVVFRRFDFEALPEWFEKQRMGDWSLHLLSARNGDFYYIPRVFGVHRLHSGSTWMLQDHNKNLGYVLGTYDSMINSSSFNNEQTRLLIKSKKAFKKLHFYTIPFKNWIKKKLRF